MENNFTNHIKNDIYLSRNDIKTLEKYDIDYISFNSMKELLFHLEDISLNSYVDDDFIDLLTKLSEYNYYFNTNK